MKNMKALAVAVFILFTGCDGVLGNKSVEIGNPGDFTVHLRSVTLNKRIDTVYNVPVTESTLGFSRKPAFATRDEVRWTSSDESVATVDPSTGKVTIQLSGDPSDPVTTTIKVRSVDDPSIYADCVLTVYPTYTLPRNWDFDSISGFTSNGGSSASNWAGITTTARLGNGAEVVREAASEYNSKGPGIWPIDPEDPYAHGVVLNGQTRNWNWVKGIGSPSHIPSVDSGAIGNRDAMIRPTGISRFIAINALWGPFKIAVIYAGNNTNGSHVDIRIGDREGIRIEGENSMSQQDHKKVSYTFTEREFVPVVYLETNDGTRIWDIQITAP
jgi:hypothetical protein